MDLAFLTLLVCVILATTASAVLTRLPLPAFRQAAFVQREDIAPLAPRSQPRVPRVPSTTIPVAPHKMTAPAAPQARTAQVPTFRTQLVSALLGTTALGEHLCQPNLSPQQVTTALLVLLRHQNVLWELSTQLLHKVLAQRALQDTTAPPLEWSTICRAQQAVSVSLLLCSPAHAPRVPTIPQPGSKTSVIAYHALQESIAKRLT